MIGTLLLIIAIVLSFVLFPIGWIYSLITARLSIKKIGIYYTTIAISIDQLGNVVMSNLFNDILVKKGGHQYGNEDETISAVLGYNKAANKNTKLAIGLAKILNWIDKDHVEKAARLKQ